MLPSFKLVYSYLHFYRCLASLPTTSTGNRLARLECNVTLYPPSSLFTTLKTAIQSIENITTSNIVELFGPITIEGHHIYTVVYCFCPK